MAAKAPDRGQNIEQYMYWRGDMLFKDRPFNDIDNLIFSQLCYARIEEYVNQFESLPMDGIAARCFSDENFDESCRGVESLKAAVQAHRFKNIVIRNIESRIDDNTQFAAMTFDISDELTYIAFRGTDDSIIGWREDFEISYRITMAQNLAVEYLERHVDDPERKYIIGGHSKGGNLAIYASMCLDPEKQKQIVKIYNNDGPGMRREIMDMTGYETIREKIVRISPEYCVVGSLFELDDIPTRYVKSSFEGTKGHDAASWQIDKEKFVDAGGISPECRTVNSIFGDWIRSLSLEECEKFTTEFFDALECNGAKRVKEVFSGTMSDNLNFVYNILRSDSATKRTIGKLIGATAKNVLYSVVK